MIVTYDSYTPQTAVNEDTNILGLSDLSLFYCAYQRVLIIVPI